MNRVYLQNLEQIFKYCSLDRENHDVKFIKLDEKVDGFYYQDQETFFAIYPTRKGPVIYYLGKEYSITPELNIKLYKEGKNRTFEIEEYNIEIKYVESPYIGFDVWSEEIDVDLFYMISQKYEDNDFYTRYTKE